MSKVTPRPWKLGYELKADENKLIATFGVNEI